MKTLGLIAVSLLVALSASAARAQEHYTEGTVARAILFRAAPGKLNDALAEMNQNLKPIYEQMKAQKLIEDYRIALNLTKANADDWDVSVRITYKNMAALDGFAAKADEITLKFYGSKEARQGAVDKRVQNLTVVGNRLVRDITLK